MLQIYPALSVYIIEQKIDRRRQSLLFSKRIQENERRIDRQFSRDEMYLSPPSSILTCSGKSISLEPAMWAISSPILSAPQPPQTSPSTSTVSAKQTSSTPSTA